MRHTNNIHVLDDNSNELNLVDIEPTDKQIEILYDLLKLREYSISHINLPEFDEHKEFVINNPYRVWMLVYQKQIPIGTIYISNDNSIGISLKKPTDILVRSLINNVTEKYKPLPAIKSRRGRHFHINLNPKNQELISILEKIGLVHIQSTYAIS